jgi:peroxiredoxin
MKAYQDDIAKFESAETQVIAMSVDSPEKNRAFAQSLGVTFPVLSDNHRVVARRYGVMIPVIRLAKRVTFVINKSGIIESVYRGEEAMDPKRSYQQSALSS